MGASQETSGRIARERDTVGAMIRLYCRRHHGQTEGLCPGCAALRAYAMLRLDRCPFAENKPTCAECPVHCYKPDMRDRIREVMRYAGPRMLLAHPLLTIAHLFDKLHKPALQG